MLSSMTHEVVSLICPPYHGLDSFQALPSHALPGREEVRHD